MSRTGMGCGGGTWLELREKAAVPIEHERVSAAKVELVVGIPPPVGEAVELRAVRVLEVRPVPVEQRLGKAQRLVGVLRVLLQLGLENTFLLAFVNSILDIWQKGGCGI